MQGDNEAGDFISRAKAMIAAWRAQYEGQQRASRFDACTNDELVRIAETEDATVQRASVLTCSLALRRSRRQRLVNVPQDVVDVLQAH